MRVTEVISFVSSSFLTHSFHKASSSWNSLGLTKQAKLSFSVVDMCTSL